jgi:AcrR family transcriptional regulator
MVHERSHSSEVSESRSERKERTRQALLNSTLELLAEKNFSNLSLREVTRSAGIVPTAFYRHFGSMDELGMSLVEDCTRTLRQMIREARRNPSADPITGTVDTLVKNVREHAASFRFLVRERYGGASSVSRAIATTLELFTHELTIDLARQPALSSFSTDDLEMAAELMVAAMLQTIQDLLKPDPRRGSEDDVIYRAVRQLRLIVLGMMSWKSPS